VVIAAKPVFHLTCRAFVPPSGISVKFACRAPWPIRRVKTGGIPKRLFRRFLKATTIELVADERAFNNALRLHLMNVGRHFCFSTYIAAQKSKILTRRPKIVFCQTFILASDYPARSRIRFSSRIGEIGPGEGWSTIKMGPRVILFDSRPLLWLPQAKFAVN